LKMTMIDKLEQLHRRLDQFSKGRTRMAKKKVTKKIKVRPVKELPKAKEMPKVKEIPKVKEAAPKEKVEKVTRLRAALDVLFKNPADRMEAKELFKQADEIYAKAHNKPANLPFAEAWARESMAVASYFGLVKLEDGFFIKTETGRQIFVEPPKIS
jgi:hypothetical protein